MAERKAVTKLMASRYARASKSGKGRMLDELCALTHWSRRHARRALAAIALPDKPRKPRPRTYDTELLEPLRFVWATLNGPSGKRLAPFMAEIAGALERVGELQLAPEPKERLLRMSSATIDRMLGPSADASGSEGAQGPDREAS